MSLLSAMVFLVQFQDIHTYANADQVRHTHLSLALVLDFDKKVINGTCEMTLAYADDKISHVDLDSSGLTIHAVTAGDKNLKWSVAEKSDFMGSKIRILLDGSQPEKIKIAYTTDPGAEAVQWLAPELTTSKKHPFLFTQSQSIFARTWIPCMDSPGVRVTYDAEITVPKALTAVMSAAHGKHDTDKGVYRFDMKHAIPPYLIALAVGELEFKAVSDRAGVYAEPAVLEKAAWEFADMERMIKVAESIYGAYDWDRWDAIVLPPSFPFGGMENPMLTFATPTLIAGDRSLVSVMAHELAHSWSGNLVTNATWSDFWLNEGFTTYFERRIVEELYGKDIAEMQKLLGQGDLHESIEEFKATPKETILFVDLKGRHPDEGFHDIPYEKGANFLLMLETHFGRERFDAFLKAYFRTFAFKPITTDIFLKHLKKELFKGDDKLWGDLLVEEWVFQPGIPKNIVVPKSDKFEKTRAAAKTFMTDGSLAGVSKETWTTNEWLDFLNSLPNSVPADKMAALDEAFSLTKAGNSEVFFAWGRLCIRNNYQPAYAAIEDFLTRQGRRKFLKPLYEAMAENPKTKEMAVKIYAKARAGYHPISVGTIDAIVKPLQ